MSAELSPPRFLRLAGHPVRWRLLSELARSDRQVRELCTLTGRPQSLVSYHLGQLRAGQVVSMRRSSADRRDTYYSLDLARCGALLTSTGGALHPGLRLDTLPPVDRPRRSRRARTRVLFLCTGNSARSQMAQALLEHLSDGAVDASSAGSHPKPLHPDAVRAMREKGVDIAGRRSTHLLGAHRAALRLRGQPLRSRARGLPRVPEQPDVIHWSIPDPAREDDVDAFRRTATELATRIDFLLQLIDHRSSNPEAI